jgi:hypothetical protein
MTKTGNTTPVEKKIIVPKPVENITSTAPKTTIIGTKTGTTTSSGSITRTGTTIRIIQ